MDSDEYFKKMFPKMDKLIEKERTARNVYSQKFKRYGFETSSFSNFELARVRQICEGWSSVGVKTKLVEQGFAGMFGLQVEHETIDMFYILLAKFKRKRLFLDKGYYIAWQSPFHFFELNVLDFGSKDNPFEQFFVSTTLTPLFQNCLHSLVDGIDGHDTFEEVMEPLSIKK